MSGRPRSILTAGMLSLVCSSILPAAEGEMNAEALLAETESPLIEQISHEQYCESACASNPDGSLLRGGGLKLFFGGEATYLNPIQDGPTSSAEVLGNATMGSGSADGFYAGPRIWLGAGLGDSPYFAQVRYWDFSGETSASLAAPGPSNVFGNSSADLAVDAFDFELGRHFLIRSIDASGQFTFGGRHVNWNQSNDVEMVQDAFLAGSSASGSGSSNFDGTGVTFSLQLNKQLGDSNWSLFGGTRFSWIWGEQSGSALASASASTLVVGATTWEYDSFSGNDTTLYIAEVQLGTQWNRRIACLNSDLFFRIALEYQYWNLQDDVEALAVSPGIPFTSVGTTARSGEMEMGLFGLALGTGMAW